jgi:hypothetical protein
MGPPWLQIWGTRILEEWTASTVPVTRTSRLTRGASGAAARVTVGVGREQEVRRRIGITDFHGKVIGIVSAIRRRQAGKCLAIFQINFA